MGLGHDRSTRAAYRPAALVHPLAVRPPPVSSGRQSPARRRNSEREAVRRELDALLSVHEPSRSAVAVDRLLDAFAGAERELLACYRQFYAPSATRTSSSTSTSCSSSSNNSRGGVRVQVSSGARPTLQLPRAAIPTLLRAKRQAQHAGAGSKADDARAAAPVACRRVAVHSPSKPSLTRRSRCSAIGVGVVCSSSMRRANVGDVSSNNSNSNTIDLSAAVAGEGLRPARRPTPADS